jgi:hypothetical protein
MVDLQLLAAYFGPGGKYQRVGDLLARVFRSKFGRYLLATAACIGLFFVFGLVAYLSGILDSGQSRQAASSVLTPVFILTVVWTWRAIVKSDKELPKARDVEIALTPTENTAQLFNAVEETAVLDAYCPNCAASVSTSAAKCKRCGASFTVEGGWRPASTPPDIKQPSRLDLYSVGRFFVWVGHVSLVLAILAISLGQTDGMLARFLLVMPFLYVAGFLFKYFYKPERRSE